MVPRDHQFGVSPSNNYGNIFPVAGTKFIASKTYGMARYRRFIIINSEPMNQEFKPRDRVFYSSRFSGILPSKVVAVGPKKIHISIDMYKKKIWVSPDKVSLQSGWMTESN